jgi:hypothetical protein
LRGNLAIAVIAGLLSFSSLVWGLEQIELVSQAHFADFDVIPATAANENPEDGGSWLYTTATINRDPVYNMTTYDWAGWRNTIPYPGPNDNLHSFFYLYLNRYNSAHMGFSTYGYLEIDDSVAVQGNSLKYRVTGGVNSCGTAGTLVTTKQHYLDSLASGTDPIGYGVKVGHPYLYFANNSSSSSPVPFPEAQGANRLSLYYYAPASLTNGQGGWGKRPEITMNLGPYNNIGGHWYHEVCNQGGGWTHVLVDGHPQHNNAWSSSASYPYPSSSLRDMGVDYFDSWYRWYVTFKPYEGISVVPYNVWLDEIEFQNDPEPQNDETICSPAVTWFPATRSFEIGFMDKYKNNQYSYSTYELRYAFEPVTNATWNSATPALILQDSRFAIDKRTDGRFAKHWPYYQSVWAPFTLANTEDLDRLVPGTRIHFAIKDISQIHGDSTQAVENTGIGRWVVGGRDYANRGDTFDYAGDKPALPLIKRIDFQIPQDAAAASGSLRVTIRPQEAATAGAQWRRLGTPAWLSSGATEDGIPVGPHTVEFKDISGWKKPSNQAVTILNDQTENLVTTYTQQPLQTGSLRVTISPKKAVSAGARWRRMGTSIWRSSGSIESKIPVGFHTVEFSDLPGWIKPSIQSISISKGKTSNTGGVYHR